MSKKRKLGRAAAKPSKHIQQSQASKKKAPRSSNGSNGNNGTASPAVVPSASPRERPTIPFHPRDDAILLVGEGDLSFAASLVDHHGCTNVTATVLEPDADALAAKYPQAAANAARILAGDGRVLYGVDVRTMGAAGSPLKMNSSSSNSNSTSGQTPKKKTMDRILFNFPHVGGKSTDVNRQVRYNQELLVAFFRRALALLAPGGSIVVTLFEGEPYTLWNIRDLGRHAGLQVERSFRFQFGAYPGYHHARTLGVVRRRQQQQQQQQKKHKKSGGGEDSEDGDDKGGEDNGDSGNKDADEDETEPEISTSAWRGEDRQARSYVFVRKDEAAQPPPAKKRRRPGDSSSSSSDDSDSDGA